MRRRTRQKLIVFAILELVSAVSGLLYGLLFELDFVYRSGGGSFAIDGLIGGFFIFGFELFVLPAGFMAPIRRQPFWVIMILRGLVLFISIMLTGLISSVVFLGQANLLQAFEAGPVLFLYVAGLMLLVAFVMQILRIVGPRVLGNLIIARYHQPVQEARIFLFLDIENSTGLSQQLGDLGAQALISRLFFDLGNIVNDHGGEVHRYIGDAMVAIWPLTQDREVNAEALQCCAALLAARDDLKQICEETFGASTGWRIGLHGGPVVAGQCGDLKQEIVYFGDTVNTAARIEAACRSYDARCLISDDLLALAALPDSLTETKIGPAALRGRAEELLISRLDLL